MIPRISIYGPAHRPQNWLDFYRSLGANDISFEIVFVGPNDPDFELPSNFKYIRSYTKPAQCAEIASRNTTADLIMNVADDYEFRTAKPLDRLYNAYKSYNNDKLMLSCRYMLNGEDRSYTDQRFIAGDDSSPIMPMFGLVSKTLYKDIGGIDRNFIAVMWDLDIAMRIYALGGEVILSDVYADELKSKSGGSNLCSDFWHHDRGLLEDLWPRNGQGYLNRARRVEPFADARILELSQGPRGRWRGSGPLAYEKLEDFWRRDRPLFSRGYRAIRNPTQYATYAKRIYRSLCRRSNIQ